MEKFVYITFSGCKVNQFEKSLLLENLIREGFSITEKPENADFIIYNTCAVTHKAEQGCRQTINKLHRINPEAKIIITGCYAELENNISKLSGVWKIIPNKDKINIPSIIQNKEIKENNPLNFEYQRTQKDRERAFLKIQDGCDSFCSYCIVPYLRGKPISMPIELVIKNLNNLKNEKEVVLTGIHLGKWGKDINLSFEKLILAISNENYPFRLRLSSLEANEISEELLKILKDMPNFCPHFHIPLQSGSNKILKLMKRNYNTSFFMQKIDLIRSFFPVACIGTDIIVGFPEEDDSAFKEMIQYIETLPIDYMHIFTYSPRKGTSAYNFKNKIGKEVVYERYKILKKIDYEKRRKFVKRFLNKEILCIKDKKIDENTYRALSREYLKVFIKGNLPENEFKAKLIDENSMSAILI